MVASAHAVASQAGASILKRGGNAFDAAVATSLVLGVVEPAFSGIGGGGFALIHTSSDENLAIDYRETAPIMSSPSMFLEHPERNSVGPLAVATPGLLAGHKTILDTFCTMKFRDLAKPAIELARSGVRRRRLSSSILLDERFHVAEKLRLFPPSSKLFGAHSLPLLADTIARLAHSGPRSFYSGSIPATVSRYLQSIGGILSEEDFNRYAVKVRKPVRIKYRGCELLSMPPPSVGGTLLALGLKMVEELGDPDPTLGETDVFSRTAAILGTVLEEKWAFGDPAYTTSPVSRLLSGRTVSRKLAKIMAGRAAVQEPSSKLGSTTHFCVVDSQGNAVAATETIECYYGSGVTVPELGVILNDEMHDFEVLPGRPNSVGPAKRPASSMSPTILLKDGSPYLILGGAGSERIISSLFHVLYNVFERRMNLPQALAEPRIHPTRECLMVEGGLGRTTISKLRKLGYTVRVRRYHDIYFGGVQAIIVDQTSGKVYGAADPRRLGSAISV